MSNTKDTFGYQWVRKSTGEFYRGIHTGVPEDNYAGSGHVFKAKYGGHRKTQCSNPDDWVRDILFIGSREECLLWESLVVTQREIDNPKCLNLVSGGDSPLYVSDETKQKMSDARSGEKHPMYGKYHSEGVKSKISSTLSGRTLTEEHKRKIAESGKGRGHSEEARKRISEAKKAYWAKRKETTMEGEVDVG